MTITRVAVFGGSGFLGRAIVDRLAAAGATVRVAVFAHPGSLKPPDGALPAGRIVSTYADVRDETSVGRALEGCDATVNAIATLRRTGRRNIQSCPRAGSDARCPPVDAGWCQSPDPRVWHRSRYQFSLELRALSRARRTVGPGGICGRHNPATQRPVRTRR